MGSRAQAPDQTSGNLLWVLLEAEPAGWVTAWRLAHSGGDLSSTAAGARLPHLDSWPWERGIKGQGWAAGEGESLLGGAECGRQGRHLQPRLPFWLTQVLPAGLDVLGQVPASPPSLRAVPAHWVGAQVPPSIFIRSLATARPAEGSLLATFSSPAQRCPQGGQSPAWGPQMAQQRPYKYLP